MSASEEGQGKVRLYGARALQYLGSIYPSVTEALSQSVENEGDAGATLIWVVIGPGAKIAVIGNGSGMIPHMLSNDAARLTDFVEGRSEEGMTLEKVVPLSSPSRRSFEWMMRCVALSTQKGRGSKGIGSLAYLQFAKCATYVTKPDPQLVLAYWGEDIGEEALEQTYTLIPPSWSDLEKGILTYKNDFAQEELIDPWGKPLPYGTRVEFDGVETEVFSADLHPLAIVSYFRRRFGEDVRKGKYSLTVVDRLTEDARRELKGEKVYKILPAEYRGDLVYDQVLRVRANTPAFRLVVYYDRFGKTRGEVKVRHKDSDKFPLTDLPAFRFDPWNSGRLSGYVDFPYSGDLLNPTKTGLLASSERNQWEKKILSVEEAIKQRIVDFQERLKEDYMREIAKDLAEVTKDALGEIEAFRSKLFPGLKVRPPAKKRTKKSGGVVSVPVTDIVYATVFDEHNHGVPKMKIELRRSTQSTAEKPVDEKTTESGGTVSFGKLPVGSYRLTLVTPSEVFVNPPSEYRFTLKEGLDAGFRAVFRVITGKLEPDRVNYSTFEPTWESLAPDTPYEERLDVGLIVFNRLDPGLSSAIAQGDEEREIALLATYTAAAITGKFIKDEPKAVTLQLALLFASIHRGLREKRLGRKRRK